MKKLFLFLIFLSFTIYAQESKGVWGYVEVGKVNHINLSLKDKKVSEFKIGLRYSFEPQFGIAGFVIGTDSTFAATGGIVFENPSWLRLDLAFGVEFERLEKGLNQSAGCVLSRLWLGKEGFSDLWINALFSNRFWLEVTYLHWLSPYFGLGVTGETEKGAGLYAQLSPVCALRIFGAAMYNGKSPEGSENKLGFNLVVKFGAQLVFE